MAQLVKANAITNNEVAFIAWEIGGIIPGCLGFEIKRQYLRQDGSVTEEVPLAAYVPFQGQSNPGWLPQNTSVWPIQKHSWRDLTLRKRRDRAERRDADVLVRYAVRPVGRQKPGLEPVVPREESIAGKKNTYEGEPLPLAYLGRAILTNTVLVTPSLPPFASSFNNGILSTQWLIRALMADDGRVEDGELKDHLVTPDDRIRSYLAGDSLPLLRDFFNRAGGRFYMALYELDDVELEALIVKKSDQIDLILSNTGKGEDEDDQVDGKVWDARNAPARGRLMKLARKRGSRFRLRNRMFNNGTQIGHNKFAVWVDDDDVPRSILTGSTNWTWTGLTGQSNNCIRIDDDRAAAAFFAYWNRLKDDELPEPDPFGDDMGGNFQGEVLREADRTPASFPVGGNRGGEIWFSPNMGPRKYGKDPDTPPDLGRVFSHIRKAREAIFFLVFYPSQQGKNSIVAEAVRLGLKDPSLLIVGAVSAAQAMFNFEPATKSPSGAKLPANSPFVYARNRVSVVRASSLGDKHSINPLGNFSREILKEGNAIIHDKILVIDPQDKAYCVVVFGSHNLGFKASYSNDENLVIVRGHQALAQAYTTHILDVYDHYRFRAAEAQLRADGKKGWDGFLDKTDTWQKRASHAISGYFAK